MLNKILSYTLILAILMTGCFAASLVEVKGSITLSFGKPDTVDPKVALLAFQLPMKQFR